MKLHKDKGWKKIDREFYVGNCIRPGLDNQGKEITFSSKMACPTCGYSIPELEPRHFTFNNPSGACPECEGLGVKPYVDESKVVHEASYS